MTRPSIIRAGKLSSVISFLFFCLTAPVCIPWSLGLAFFPRICNTGSQAYNASSPPLPACLSHTFAVSLFYFLPSLASSLLCAIAATRCNKRGPNSRRRLTPKGCSVCSCVPHSSPRDQPTTLHRAFFPLAKFLVSRRGESIDRS